MGKFSVLLIHGTFAEGAAWTQPEKSKLCAFLKSQFGSDIEFERLDWEGSNRHKARVKASQKLLTAYRPGGPFVHRLDQPHFVIAHSHGGNALAYALREESKFSEALSGVAFLSTPFIQARERRRARWVLTLLPWAVAYFSACVVVVLCVIGYEMLGLSEVTDLAAWTVVAAVLVVFVLALFLVSEKIGDPATGLPKGVEPSVRQAVSEVDLGALACRGLNSKTLIVRANADEASSVLGAAHILSRLIGEIPARIASLPRAVANTIAKRFGALALAVNQGAERWLGFVFVAFSGAFLLALCLPIVEWVTGPGYLQTNFPRISLVRDIAVSFLFDGLFMGAIWFLLIVAVVSTVLALIGIPLIVLVFKLAFGRWYLLSALFLEVSVETTPPGEWRVNQLDLANTQNSENLAESFTLAHSMSYDDPRAHQIIADWIRVSLGKLESLRPSARSWPANS